MDKPKILVVDDDTLFLQATGVGLENEFMQAILAENGKKALAAVKKNPDLSLALVDIGLPDMSGYDLYHAIRAESKAQVIFLTARRDPVDEVKGLAMGAVGYLKKPIDPMAVAAQVKAMLRLIASRSAAAAAAKKEDEADFEIKDQPQADFLIDDKAKAIYYKGIDLNLTSKMFVILKAMVLHPHQVFSLGDFLDMTDPEGAATEQSPRNYIKKIRQRLRKVAPDEKFIRNHHNNGYSLI
jgi:two-component system catabolic regulation response regulator CreB